MDPSPPPEPQPSAFLHETPQEAVRDVELQEIAVGKCRFKMLRPTQPYRLLDHPTVIRAFEKDEYLPYWAELWPSSVLLAEVLLAEAGLTALEALELGCGLGLAGIVALSRGVRVTFSDYDATALHFAARNARLNGFEQFDLLRFDWRNPPFLHYPLIFGADLLYEERNIAPILNTICNMLSGNGLCLIVDPNRRPAESFRAGLDSLRGQGLVWSAGMLRGTLGNCAHEATLYRIRRTSPEPRGTLKSSVADDDGGKKTTITDKLGDVLNSL